jgi:catalase (peroxidase I)
MAIRHYLPLFRASLRAGTLSTRKVIFNVGSNVFSPRLIGGLAFSVATGLSIGSSLCLAPKVNWDQVKNDIKAILDDDDYDDGHIGPILIRLAWHASGTYDAKSKTGGSDGATMRYQPEANHGANAGLIEARKRLEKIAAKHPGLSIADLWVLAAYVAIEDMGGPKIPFSPGRHDKPSGEYCPPYGRLPDADGRPGAGPITVPTTIAHIRNTFYRMGLNDQEIVALCGAHGLGRCHKGDFPEGSHHPVITPTTAEVACCCPVIGPLDD